MEIVPISDRFVIVLASSAQGGQAVALGLGAAQRVQQSAPKSSLY